MKVVVGLGNPGPKYASTRHNAGFAVVLELARRWGAEGKLDTRFNAVLAEARVGPEKVLLVQPLTFMNLSGRSVQSLMNFFKVPVEELVVVSDDVDLPIGTLRLRKGGSSGGQKGMQSVVEHLGTDMFPRVRVGIGARPPEWKMEDWVLSRFTPEEQPEFEAAVKAAADAVELWVRRNDFNLAMNRHNTPRKKKEAGEEAAARTEGKGEGKTEGQGKSADDRTAIQGGRVPEQQEQTECNGGSMGRNEKAIPPTGPRDVQPPAQD